MTPEEIYDTLATARDLVSLCVPHLPQYPAQGSSVRLGPKSLAEETVARIGFVLEGLVPSLVLPGAE